MFDWFKKKKVTPLPDAFSPLTNNKWILQVEGIDAFLLRRLDLPSFQNEHPYKGVLRAELHNVIGLDSNGPLLEMLGAEPTSGVLKLLDKVGTIIEVWVFEEMDLIEVTWNPLDYGDPSPLITVARFEVSLPEISPTVPFRYTDSPLKSDCGACSTLTG